MPNLHDFPCREPIVGRIAAAMLLATLAAGCARPLSVQHEYFSPLNGSTAGTSEQTRHVVSRSRALQAAQHRCPPPVHASAAPGETKTPDGPDIGSTAAREALADLCATLVRSPEAAYGGTSNAYRRWVEDQVRELPETSETAAGAAGGS